MSGVSQVVLTLLAFLVTLAGGLWLLPDVPESFVAAVALVATVSVAIVSYLFLSRFRVRGRNSILAARR